MFHLREIPLRHQKGTAFRTIQRHSGQIVPIPSFTKLSVLLLISVWCQDNRHVIPLVSHDWLILLKKHSGLGRHVVLDTKNPNCLEAGGYIYMHEEANIN